FSGSVFAQEMTSPDEKLKVTLKSDAKRAYNYSVLYDGKTVFEPSKLGVVRMDADFTKDLYIISVEKVEKVKDQYEMLNAKKRHISYEANKYVYHFRNGKGNKLDLIFQLSNDGVAFRYYFPEK